MAAFPAAGALMEVILDPEVMRDDPARMRAVLVSSGITLSAASVALIVRKPPEGIFLRLHGGAPAYYGLLGATALYGLAEASFGLLAVARNPARWGAAGRILLRASLPPLVLIFALGGLALLKQ